MDEHMPVLVEESLAALALEADGYYVDATFGRGGHTARILQALGREGSVLALDRDAAAIAAGRARFANEMRLALVHAPFADACDARAPLTRTAARAGVCSSTSVSHLPSSTTRLAVSASGRTARSTCVWMRHAASPYLRGSLARASTRFAR